MLPKILSLLFPPTNAEKILESCTYLQPEPSVRTSETGNTLYSCARYDEEHVHAAIKILKKHGTQHSARLLAQLLSDVLLEELGDMHIWESSAVVIIPMPLSKQRLRRRGFNQMERVCTYLPNELQSRIAKDVLMRTKDSPEQKSLMREQRLENVKNAFTATSANKLTNANVIVIDDVLATGATLNEAVTVLRSTDAQKVVGIALARA